MTGIPSWLGATSGQGTQAGQVNQFLGAHAVTFLYQGTAQSSQTTAGSGTVGSFGQYVAQSFTTGSSQTAIGYVTTVESTTATLPTSTLQVSIYASSGGAPTGSPLITVTASQEYVRFAPISVAFPVPLTVTPSTTYFIVTAPSGQSGTQDFTWAKSNQTSGAYLSTNGTTWSSQTYGLQYGVYDQSATGPLTATWEDAGARWIWLGYSSSLINKLAEYTVAQNSGYIQADRTLAYSGTSLVSVT